MEGGVEGVQTYSLRDTGRGESAKHGGVDLDGRAT